MVLRAQWPQGTIAQFFLFVAEEKKKRQKNKGILWLGYHRYPSNEHISVKKMKRMDHVQSCQLFLE